MSEKKSLFFPSLPGRMHYSVAGEHVPRSASRDSIRSTYSEPGYVRPRPHSLGQLRHSSIDRYSHIDWSTTSGIYRPMIEPFKPGSRHRSASFESTYLIHDPSQPSSHHLKELERLRLAAVPQVHPASGRHLPTLPSYRLRFSKTGRNVRLLTARSVGRK